MRRWLILVAALLSPCVTAAQGTLIDRLDTGRWPEEAELPATLNALAERLDRESPLELAAPAFVRFTAPQALRTWDFSNWGTYKPPR